MSDKTVRLGKIPEKFDDNVVLFLCRGPDRRKVRFRKRDAVPKFKQEVMYDNSFTLSLYFSQADEIYFEPVRTLLSSLAVVY